MTLKLLQTIKRTRRRRVASYALVLLLTWPLLAWVAARLLIVRAGLERADAIVVLSGGWLYQERAARAAELYAQGRAPRVILTTDGTQGPWSDELERNPTYTEMELDSLLRAGIPRESIEVYTQVIRSTYDEATRLRDYAQRRGLRSILVVTSAYHTRRALWVWRRVFAESGIEIGIEPAPVGEQLPRPATWWWHARGWRTVAGEYPKFVYYWLRYF